MTKRIQRRSRTPTRSPRDATTPERRRLPLLLRRAWFSLNQAFRRRCAQEGLTPDQFTALRTLLEHEPAGLTQRGLVEKITSDPNTVASLLKRMEASGLIERRADPADRRALRLYLKPAGRGKFARLRRRAVALQVGVLSALPESRREAFLEELEVIANACQQELKHRRSEVAGIPARGQQTARKETG